MKRRTIYTIGYERRAVPNLVSLLRRAEVRALFDVRNVASGHYAAHRYRPEIMQIRLEPFGITHYHAQALGVPQDAREQERATGFVGYRAMIRKRLGEIRRGETPGSALARTQTTQLGMMLTRIEDGNIAVLCKERKNEECHRTALAEELATAATRPEVMTVEVRHL